MKAVSLLLLSVFLVSSAFGLCQPDGTDCELCAEGYVCSGATSTLVPAGYFSAGGAYIDGAGKIACVVPANCGFIGGGLFSTNACGAKAQVLVGLASFCANTNAQIGVDFGFVAGGTFSTDACGAKVKNTGGLLTNCANPSAPAGSVGYVKGGTFSTDSCGAKLADFSGAATDCAFTGAAFGNHIGYVKGGTFTSNNCGAKVSATTATTADCAKPGAVLGTDVGLIIGGKFTSDTCGAKNRDGECYNLSAPSTEFGVVDGGFFATSECGAKVKNPTDPSTSCFSGLAGASGLVAAGFWSAATCGAQTATPINPVTDCFSGTDSGVCANGNESPEGSDAVGDCVTCAALSTALSCPTGQPRSCSNDFIDGASICKRFAARDAVGGCLYGSNNAPLGNCCSDGYLANSKCCV